MVLHHFTHHFVSNYGLDELYSIGTVLPTQGDKEVDCHSHQGAERVCLHSRAARKSLLWAGGPNSLPDLSRWGCVVRQPDDPLEHCSNYFCSSQTTNEPARSRNDKLKKNFWVWVYTLTPHAHTHTFMWYFLGPSDLVGRQKFSADNICCCQGSHRPAPMRTHPPFFVLFHG